MWESAEPFPEELYFFVFADGSAFNPDAESIGIFESVGQSIKIEIQGVEMPQNPKCFYTSTIIVIDFPTDSKMPIGSVSGLLCVPKTLHTY